MAWTMGEARADMAEAPFAELDDLCGSRKRLAAIAVVAPHPDDETLGCGGLIALAARSGRRVLVAVATDGAASHPGSVAFPPRRLARVRLAEARAAATILGRDRVKVESFGAPDGRLHDHTDDLSAWLGTRLAAHAVGSVFVTWDADPHPDHRAAFAAAAAAARALELDLWAYPVWGLVAADTAPAGPRRDCRRLDVRTTLSLKAAAISAHASQTGGLIDDDLNGFSLKPSDVARHLTGEERFMSVRYG